MKRSAVSRPHACAIIPVEYDLSTVLNDLVNMVQARANDKGLSITLDFDRETPKLLCGDEVRVKQVITNILRQNIARLIKPSVLSWNPWILLHIII